MHHRIELLLKVMRGYVSHVSDRYWYNTVQQMK